MLGGAKIVRLVVLQESRITASATVPPTPQSSFSRLPSNHRVSLECHTNGEYVQNDKMMTTHFYGKNPSIFSIRYFVPILTRAQSPAGLTKSVAE
jgi:hypothetical protein